MGLARVRLSSLIVVAGLVTMLFAVSESTRVKKDIGGVAHAHVPPKDLRAWVGFQPPALRRYARNHLVYHPAYPGIGASREADLYPGGDNIETLLWSGVQPRYLVNALLKRRFDLVFLFENDGFRGDTDGYGPWEENYFWKLNQLITAKYRAATGPRRALKWAGLVFVPVASFYSTYVFERRPGPDRAPWMNRCFGPFHVEGATFRIAHGGGFWCRTRPGASTLRLVATPAALSEVRDDHFAAGPGAALAVRLAHRGAVRVSLGSWHAARSLAAGERALIPIPPRGVGRPQRPGHSGLRRGDPAEADLTSPARAGHSRRRRGGGLVRRSASAIREEPLER